MLEITWFKGKNEIDGFFIYESHTKKLVYDEYIDRDDVYEMIFDKLREGFIVQLNAI